MFRTKKVSASLRNAYLGTVALEPIFTFFEARTKLFMYCANGRPPDFFLAGLVAVHWLTE